MSVLSLEAKSISISNTDFTNCNWDMKNDDGTDAAGGFLQLAVSDSLTITDSSFSEIFAKKAGAAYLYVFGETFMLEISNTKVFDV